MQIIWKVIQPLRAPSFSNPYFSSRYFPQYEQVIDAQKQTKKKYQRIHLEDRQNTMWLLNMKKIYTF